MSEIVVCCRQLAPRIGELERNAESVGAAIRAAGAEGADLVVLPELASSGYVFTSAAEVKELAQPADGPLLRAWVEATREAAVLAVVGFAELGEGGEVFDSAALIDVTGVLAVYRKTHLWDREKLFFAAGSEPPPVVETRLGRIGLLICYDLEFAENVRGLALRGAELVAVPANWPARPHPRGERAPEVVNAMAQARANRVFVAVADRAGEERGQAWIGGSSIIDQLGLPLAEAPGAGEATISARVDLALARDKRWTKHADALGDRRPELYGDVVDTKQLLGKIRG